MPEVIPASCCGDLSNAGGPTGILTDADKNRHDSGADFVSQVLDPHFNSPPIFLQNLALLI